MKNYIFTIFTPLHNGEKTIKRVFDSLKSSIYREFEWIIINDGSTDNSCEVIATMIKSVDWDITFINWEKNRGKHIAWNEAVKIAKGEIFINIDCDDAFEPESLTFFNEKWNEHFENKRISGIDVLCTDADSKEVCGTQYPYNGIISNYKEFYNIYNIRGDKWNSFRTEYVKMFPFPELEANYYTECYLHYSLAEKFLTVGYNERLHKYYRENTSITHVKVETKNNLYMIKHYQQWHIPRVALCLLKENPRELGRCIKELFTMTFKYKIMSWLKIKEIKYDVD